MKNDNRRKSYTIKEKLAAVDRINSGVSISKVKTDLGIPEGTLRGWIADEAKLRSFLENLDNTPALERKRSRLGKNKTVEDCLYVWYVEQRRLGLPVSGRILKQQAEKIFKEKNLEGDFSASTGWLNRWQKRRGIGKLKRRRKTKPPNQEVLDNQDLNNSTPIIEPTGSHWNHMDHQIEDPQLINPYLNPKMEDTTSDVVNEDPYMDNTQTEQTSLYDPQNHQQPDLQNEENQENRHLLFFRSLLPSLRSLDDGQTLRFQSGIINLLQDIKGMYQL